MAHSGKPMMKPPPMMPLNRSAMQVVIGWRFTTDCVTRHRPGRTLTPQRLAGLHPAILIAWWSVSVRVFVIAYALVMPLACSRVVAQIEFR